MTDNVILAVRSDAPLNLRFLDWSIEDLDEEELTTVDDDLCNVFDHAAHVSIDNVEACFGMVLGSKNSPKSHVGWT